MLRRHLPASVVLLLTTFLVGCTPREVGLVALTHPAESLYEIVPIACVEPAEIDGIALYSQGESVSEVDEGVTLDYQFTSTLSLGVNSGVGMIPSDFESAGEDPETLLYEWLRAGSVVAYGWSYDQSAMLRDVEFSLDDLQALQVGRAILSGDAGEEEVGIEDLASFCDTN